MSTATGHSRSEVTRPCLVTVDDDPDVSRAVARDLRRRYGEHYRVVRAESGEQALDALKQMKLRGDAVAILLADYRMPQMSGLEFLEAAMDIYPAARRVLLTAYADTGAAIEAINVVDLDYYLLKPWDPPEEKLYPVLDAQLEAWKANDYQPVPETKVVGHRWSARSSEVREFLARNQVPYRWYPVDTPEAGAAAAKPPTPTSTTLPLVVDAGRHRAGRPVGHRARRPRRADHHAGRGLLRPGRDRRRTGRPGRGRLRRVRGSAHRADRADRHRRAGRAELADRELPRLPRRGVRRASDRPGPAAGREIRRGADHHPGRRRRWRSTAPPARSASPTAKSIDAHTVILATGVSYRQARRAAGLDDFTGRGVYYGSALTEATNCADQDVYIVGGANSAGQAAVNLAKGARSR